MKLSFRWYGEDDKVTLENIRQIPGMQSIVTAVYDVPVGEVWSRESIAKLKKQVEDAGLGFDVIESIPVHEDIKLGKPTRDKYIENYCENIRRVAEAGIKCICYNFMPVFDWTRTQLDHVLADGSTSLVYYQEQVDAVNPLNSDSDLTLPGWDSSYTREGLKAVVAEYNNLSEEDLWNNLQYFLERVIPVAAECDVNMAIHEDDPCWSIFGLPRIITCEENLDRFLKLVDDKHNGITLCTGSLGCSGKNDVVKMAAKYAAMGRIHFAHLRNVAVLDNGFEERAHLSSCGSLDMFGIVKALVDNGFDGYVRPDHGRMIWGETGRAGYGLYDRALRRRLFLKEHKIRVQILAESIVDCFFLRLRQGRTNSHKYWNPSLNLRLRQKLPQISRKQVFLAGNVSGNEDLSMCLLKRTSDYPERIDNGFQPLHTVFFAKSPRKSLFYHQKLWAEFLRGLE